MHCRRGNGRHGPIRGLQIYTLPRRTIRASSKKHHQHVAGQRKDGTYIFKWEAQLEKSEAQLRKQTDDDEYNIWDQYTEAKNEYLKKLNNDRKKEGWTTELTKLPQIHATALLKRFLTKKESK